MCFVLCVCRLTPAGAPPVRAAPPPGVLCSVVSRCRGRVPAGAVGVGHRPTRSGGHARCLRRLTETSPTLAAVTSAAPTATVGHTPAPPVSGRVYVTG